MTKKMIYVILLAIILSLSINVCGYTKVYAEDEDTVDSVMSGARSFIEIGGDSTVNYDELYNTSDFIYNLLLAVAIILAVALGMVIGIQFMMAGIEEKAKIKEQLLPYVVGCVVVFGAFGIWKLAITIFSNW